MDRASFVCRQYIGLTPHPDSLLVCTWGEGGGEIAGGCDKGGKGVCFSAGKMCLFQSQRCKPEGLIHTFVFVFVRKLVSIFRQTFIELVYSYLTQSNQRSVNNCVWLGLLILPNSISAQSFLQHAKCVGYQMSIKLDSIIRSNCKCHSAASLLQECLSEIFLGENLPISVC